MSEQVILDCRGCEKEFTGFKTFYSGNNYHVIRCEGCGIEMRQVFSLQQGSEGDSFSGECLARIEIIERWNKVMYRNNIIELGADC